MARGDRGNRGGSFPGRRRNPGGISKRGKGGDRPERGDRDDNSRPRRGAGQKRGGRMGKRGNDRRPNKKVTGEDLDKEMAKYWGDNKKTFIQDDLDEQMDDYFKKPKTTAEDGAPATDAAATTANTTTTAGAAPAAASKNVVEETPL